MKTVEEMKEMKEFKGTKGEWIFDDTDMKIKGSGDVEGRTVIANVSPGMDYSRGMTTQCANTQLIAAAPEILKELIDFCKTFESTIGYQGYDHNTFVALNDRYIKSKKTIKKALGL